MGWTVRISESALKELSRLGHQAQKDILKYLKTRIECSEDPRVFGKALRYTNELWRYRVGKYRLICSIQDKVYTVLVLNVGKRDKIYESF